MPKDTIGNGLLQSDQERASFLETILDALHTIIVKVVESLEFIDPKMEASIEIINEEYSVENHSENLINIYVEYFI